MFKDSREDIYDINVGFLGIFPRNIRVLIIGGGSVGFLKAKGLIKQGINNIDVISREFIDDFYKIEVNLICEEVSIDILNKYHFIVVAVEEYKDIKAMLDSLNKLYVICADSREGNCFVPVVIKSKGFSLGITSNGSPKGTCFLRDKILDSVLRYDEFLYETRRIREEVKMLGEKDKIINFIYTDDFYFFYLKGKHNLVLELFLEVFMIRVATRKSTLAQVQADKIIELIKEKLNVEAKKVLYTTKGDRILDKTLDKVGGKGLFVKDIEVALLKGEADCAVHSMKDVPFDLNDEFEIVATPVREDARDAFVSMSGQSFFELRKGARVGTSSRRRAMQLLSLRSDLEIVPIRGNVETRIRKIEEEELDGIVLAAAGLKRLNLEAIITDYFDVENFIPASNQGILGVEVLKKSLYKEHLKKIDDEEVHFCCMVEKYVMKLLNGGCHSASCAYAKLNRDRIYIIASNEVSGVLKKGSIEGNKEDYINLCKKLVERIV